MLSAPPGSCCGISIALCPQCGFSAPGLLDSVPGLALGTNQQVQPGIAAVACSESCWRWRAPRRGWVGIRSWGWRGSCGSGLGARSCGGVESLERAWGGFVPGSWLTPSVGGDTEVRGEPAAGSSPRARGCCPRIAPAPLPAECRERSIPGSGAGPGLGRALGSATRWECRDGEWALCRDRGILVCFLPRGELRLPGLRGSSRPGF